MAAPLSEATLQDLVDRYSKEGKPLPEFSQSTIEALYSLGYGFYQNGKHEKAAHFFRFLTLLDNNDARHWMGLGAALQMTKQYHHAIQCFSCAAVLTPHSPLPPFHAAECFLSLGERIQAEKVFDAAEQIANKVPNLHQQLLTRISLMRS